MAISKNGKLASSAASWRQRRAARANSAASRQVTKRQRLVRVLIIFLAVVIVCGYLDRGDVYQKGGGVGFNYFERFPQKVRVAMAWARNSDKVERVRNSIVLLAISDETFDPKNDLHLPGPVLPRNYHARLIRELTRAGAKAIAIDLIFEVPGPHDAELARAAKETGNVIWANLFENDAAMSSPAILPVPELLKASPYYGHVHVPQNAEIPEVDRIRAVYFDENKRPVPSFSLATALKALGLQQEPLRRIGKTWRVGNLTIPVDSQGYFYINFLKTADPDAEATLAENSVYTVTAGKESEMTPAGSATQKTLQNEDWAVALFQPDPYENVYSAATDKNNRRGLIDDPFYGKSNFFRDKIVIIGNSTRVGNDFRTTAAGYMWGPEIHAHALATILMAANGARPFARDVPENTNLLVMIVLTALVCALASSWRLVWAGLGTAALLFIYAIVNIRLFTDYGIQLHMVAPTAAMFLAALGVVTERSLTEEREKNRMHGLLQRYVSPQVAAYLVAHPERMGLGGESVTATVLFSDIRGFTSMSEKLSPTEVLTRLNEYLQAMTDVVFKHDGAVDKYIGDAIMAHYGTLLIQPDHARRAVATAIDMQTALLELQASWQAQGLPLIDIGIGINTGDMVVGNMGSVQRTDFSVIGDTVNLASRVESLNKEMGSRILITRSTYEAVKDEVEVRGPLTAAVKGKEEAAEVYEVYGWKGGNDSQK